MSRVILRLQSLAFREDGERSTIHLDVEDDAAIAPCRAGIEERADGRLDVGELCGYRGGIDAAAFRTVVERIYWEQVKRIRTLAAAVGMETSVGEAGGFLRSIPSCIVALGPREIVLEGDA